MVSHVFVCMSMHVVCLSLSAHLRRRGAEVHSISACCTQEGYSTQTITFAWMNPHDVCVNAELPIGTTASNLPFPQLRVVATEHSCTASVPETRSPSPRISIIPACIDSSSPSPTNSKVMVYEPDSPSSPSASGSGIPAILDDVPPSYDEAASSVAAEHATGSSSEITKDASAFTGPPNAEPLITRERAAALPEIPTRKVHDRVEVCDGRLQSRESLLKLCPFARLSSPNPQHHARHVLPSSPYLPPRHLQHH